MIKYSVICGNGHEFEGWYKDSKQFDNWQKQKKLICGQCDSQDIEKAPMAPSINRGNPQSMRHPELEYVGNRFPEEMRKDASRPLIGLATHEEVERLRDEGHEIYDFPPPVYNPKKDLN